LTGSVSRPSVAHSRTPPSLATATTMLPDRSATAVRDPLVLTGNPWNRPAARFAAPIPSISPLPSISCPVRAANADAVEIVASAETTAQTGVEMEALVAASVAALTVYDMAKGVDPAMEIGEIRLLEKVKE